MAQRLVILADDLTGACDAAGTLTRYGPARVALNGSMPGDRIAALDLDTRRLTGLAARRRVARAARAIDPDVLLFKKVDSQLRGNVAAELRGLLDAGRFPVVFVPALPEEGRTTIDGVHRFGRRRVDIRRMLRGLGPMVLTGDAQSRGDLRRWARRLGRVHARTTAGSAGLAAELPLALGWRRHRTGAHWRPASRVLVAVGSTDLRALGQLRALARARRCAVHRPAETKAIAADLQCGLALVGGRAAALARRVAKTPADAIDALVLCGGETARAVLVASGAQTLRLRAEVLPRIPLAVIEGGRLTGRLVVTKAGSFGASDAFVRAVTALQAGHA